MSGLPVRTKSIRYSFWNAATIAATGLAIGMLLPAVASAQTVPVNTTVTPAAWPSAWLLFYTSGGSAAVRDPEGGKSTDSSNGGASFTAESDLASNWNDKVPVNNPCNPIDPVSEQCGAAVDANATMWWAYDDNGTTWDGFQGSSSMMDDTLFFRMRINGDPRETGGTTNRLNNSHWNFLHDVDNDGYKEFWFDVFGNQDIVRVLYENNGSQQITNEDARVAGPPCASPLGVWLDTLVACASTSGTTAGGYSCANSFTRALPITESQGAPNPTSTEWFIDLQIPIKLVRIPNDGCETPFPAWLTGCATDGYCYLIEPTSSRRFVYSTSDSSVDPLQKDFTPGCNTVGGVLTTCNFTEPTPVTVASFKATNIGGLVQFEWSTGSELGNAGFDVYAKVGGDWMQLNPQLIPSKVVDSLSPVEYRFVADAMGAELFAIVDVDIEGTKRWHGDFELGREYGTEHGQQPTDWAAIGNEHAQKAAARKAARKASAVSKVKNAKSGAAEWPVYELRVEQDGLYRVTYEALAAAGLDLAGVATSRIGLTNRGAAIPIRVVGGASNQEFGSGGFIEFFGEGLDTLYTRTNVYLLVVESKSAKRVHEDKGSPSTKPVAVTTTYTETTTVENDNLWRFAAPNGDPWIDREILAYTSPEDTDDDVPPMEMLKVDHLVTGDATLSVELWGVTNWSGGPPDHHVQVSLNGTFLGESSFDGLANAPLEFAIPTGVLHEGDNKVTIALPGDTGFAYDMVSLDGYAVTYQRSLTAVAGGLRFRAGGPTIRVSGFPSDDMVGYRLDERAGPVLLTGMQVKSGPGGYSATIKGGRGEAEYVLSTASSMLVPDIAPMPVTGDLTSGPADYLIITHPDFTDDLGALVAARQAQGLAVKVVETDAIYSAFGYGIFDPEALRDYVTFAVKSLGTRFVLLVGGETFDHLDNTGSGSISFVPTFYERTGTLVAFTPVDGPIADGDGDLIPDAAIGRLPARSSADVAAMIAKTLVYPAPGSSFKAVFAADRSEPFADFGEISDQVAATLPGGWSVERAYIDDLDVAGANLGLTSAINGGVALTYYLGHSDLNFWSFEGLFDNADAEALTNAGQPTVVAQFGCWNTFFAMPTAASLAERLLVSGDRGAAAVIGPAGRTGTDGDREMGLLLIQRMAQPGMTLGEALTQAKHEIRAMNGGLIEIYLGFNLLGDPALMMVP